VSLRLVSTLAGNVDIMAADVADRLTEAGLPCYFKKTASPEDFETLQNADILWMCGYLTSRLIDSEQLLAEIIAAPNFVGEAPTTYRTFFIGRVGDKPPERWAMNEPDSWSGHHAIVHDDAHTLPPIEPAEIVWTGSHLQSLEAVLSSRADIAPIDSTVWTWAQNRFPNLEIRSETRPWPAPPLLLHTNQGHLRERISEVIVGPYNRSNLAAIIPATNSHCDPIRKASGNSG